MTELFPDLDSIQKRLSVTFSEPQLLGQAFVHSSYVNEHPELALQSNERLEFLGDAVLQLLISEELYGRCPTMPEGELSQLRSQIVDARSCAGYLEALDVKEFLLLGRGEQRSDRGRSSIYSDLFEAIVGAIYLDGGIEAAQRFVHTHCSNAIDATVETPQRNFRSELQDRGQREHGEPPLYRVTAESGPDHDKKFEVEVLVGGDVVGWGGGASKKEAQTAAAQDAIERMEQE